MSENEGFQFDRKSETPHFKEFFSAIPLIPLFPPLILTMESGLDSVTVVIVGGKQTAAQPVRQ